MILRQGSCPNDLIKTSRIYQKDYRELRSITRSREALVNARSKFKNQIHQMLAVCCIKLSCTVDTYWEYGNA
ncbi:MAG: transposase [Methanothrix sp.]